MLFLALFAVLAPFVSGQSCDYSQNVVAGQTYYVYSPNYPNFYGRNLQCRWIATCPTGYNCRIDCSEINMPQSNQCSQDRLLVSRSGDPQLTGANTYCGRGTLSLTSTGTRLSIGLISTSNSAGGRFACSLYAQRASTPVNPQCSCGYKKGTRIVGGQQTGVNEFPMMAGLIDTRIYEIKCGAVIIYSHYLLTAAHCVASIGVGNMAVVVGEHNVDTADSPATQTLRVSDVLIHPSYNSANYDNDIAIILTAGEIRFSDLVGPACLPFKFAGNSLNGAVVTVLGWGTQFSGGPTSNVLMGANLNVISQSQCQSYVSTLTSRQLCTFTSGKDACQDDSGGPLLYTDPSNGLLYNVGIISYGRFCASGEPGINTRVTEFLNWILANTPDANYCRL